MKCGRLRRIMRGPILMLAAVTAILARGENIRVIA
jgi:hypothetical protein